MMTRNATASVLLVLSAALATGCGAAGDTGHAAAVQYIGPFLGITEETFGGTIFGDNCGPAIKLAQEAFDQESDARLALKADVEKHRNDDGFKEKFAKAAQITEQEAFTNFAEQCPEESKTFDALVDSLGEELGLGDAAPPYPPEK